MVNENSPSQLPRIYVACLAAYNNAKLHGAWIDATQGAEGIRAAIQAVLETSPEPNAEEHAIHDHDGFGTLNIGEYEDVEHVAALGEFVEEHGEFGAELVSHTGSLDEAEEVLQERYVGTFASVAEFAEDLLEESGRLEALPEDLHGYFDFAAYGRDLVMSGELDTLQVGGELHVFWTG